MIPAIVRKKLFIWTSMNGNNRRIQYMIILPTFPVQFSHLKAILLIYNSNSIKKQTNIGQLTLGVFCQGSGFIAFTDLNRIVRLQTKFGLLMNSLHSNFSYWAFNDTQPKVPLRQFHSVSVTLIKLISHSKCHPAIKSSKFTSAKFSVFRILSPFGATESCERQNNNNKKTI